MSITWIRIPTTLIVHGAIYGVIYAILHHAFLWCIVVNYWGNAYWPRILRSFLSILLIIYGLTFIVEALKTVTNFLTIAHRNVLNFVAACDQQKIFYQWTLSWSTGSSGTFFTVTFVTQDFHLLLVNLVSTFSLDTTMQTNPNNWFAFTYTQPYRIQITLNERFCNWISQLIMLVRKQFLPKQKLFIVPHLVSHGHHLKMFCSKDLLWLAFLLSSMT